MIEAFAVDPRLGTAYFCNTCAHEWTVPLRSVGRFDRLDELVSEPASAATSSSTLADIGALNAFRMRGARAMASGTGRPPRG